MNLFDEPQPALFNRRMVAVGALAIALIAAGLWTRHEMMAARIQDIFAVGPLSPVRAEFPSVVSDAQLRQIERREQQLHEELQWQSRMWQSAMIGCFLAAAISVAVLLWLLHQQMQLPEEDDFQ